jgi:hypothetical protein
VISKSAGQQQPTQSLSMHSTNDRQKTRRSWTKFRLVDLIYDAAVAPAEEARALALKAREIAKGREALFHGTRYRERILASGFLKQECGAVSLTRSAKVAAYFATLPRDNDEGSGAILVFDRALLSARYRLDCVDNSWQVDPLKFNEFWRAEANEFEECVYERNIEIAPYLIGLVTSPLAALTRKGRAVRRAKELWLARQPEVRPCRARRFERLRRKASQLEHAYPGIRRLWTPMTAAEEAELRALLRLEK